MVLLTLFSAVSLFYLGATLFLFCGLKRLSSHSNGPKNLTYSIVIAARNEETTIAACLESVFSQTIDPHRYEVILVDDRSNDRTVDVAKSLAAKHPKLSILTIQQTPAGLSPKKHAVSQGVTRAKNEIVVFTDADCRVPPTWLDTIDRQFAADVGLVQGVTTYSYVKGMNAFFFGVQALDFLSHGIVAAAAIGSGFPLNSNANNLAFRKAAFDQLGGYGSAGSVVSGDDDLLLQRIGKCKKWAIRYMVDPHGAVETSPALTVKAMFEQRKRWGSKTVHYNKQQVVFLGGIFCFYLSIMASFLAALFSPKLWFVFAGMLLVKLLGESILMIPGTALFNKKELRSYIVPASILQPPMVVCAVVLGVFGKFTWKGQSYSRMIHAKK
jgi:cellulose synthase/poly-beta-1,6-N-acetylglucosamine synthase-like glycosyltransferase